jgi:hypothetical protein
VWFEHGVNVASRSAGVVGQGHCGTAEDIDVTDYSAPDQSLTEPAEGILDRTTIQQRLRASHATSSS